MKSFVGLLMLAAVTVVFAGCDNGETVATPEGTDKAAATTKVSLDADLCGKCGCCAECEDCCKGEVCTKCGMQEGTALCCSGVKPSDVVYCKKCGFEKGAEKCCAESNEACSCGMAKGSPLCCKVKDVEADHEGHDHEDKEEAAK